MSTGGIIAIVVGALALIFFATSKGLIKSGVAGPGGIVAPQPSQNYGGYLAATTAPQVSGLLGSLISGVTNASHSWFGAPAAATPVVGQGANPASPSLAAQPQPTMYSDNSALIPPSSGQPTNSTVLSGFLPSVGPSITDGTSYNATNGSAFSYGSLSADNSYDPNASLEYVL